MTRHLSQDSQTDELMSQVAATAMSSRRSVVVRANAMGFVRYVTLSNEARQWDSGHAEQAVPGGSGGGS